jgi:hypothetical protein
MALWSFWQYCTDVVAVHIRLRVVPCPLLVHRLPSLRPHHALLTIGTIATADTTGPVNLLSVKDASRFHLVLSKTPQNFVICSREVVRSKMSINKVQSNVGPVDHENQSIVWVEQCDVSVDILSWQSAGNG